MATTDHKVTGKAMWARVFEHNRDLKGYNDAAVPYEGFYKIDVILDKDNRKILSGSGSSLKGKWTDDGEFIVTFKRKHKDRFEWASGAPKVLKADDTPWTDKFIPNTSEVEVEFSVYTTTKATGTRLETVKVLEVADMPEREEEAPKAPSKPTRAKADLDDEIPF
jgi:hypothetical protein